MPPTKLIGVVREQALKEISKWSEVTGRDAIQRKFMFKNFTEAFGWMGLVAKIADQTDHHPEWFNVYNRVEVTLSTHDCDGISQLDVDLAKQMDSLYEKKKSIS